MLYTQYMKKALFVFIGIVVVAGALFAVYIWKCEDDWCFIFEWQKIQAADSFERCVNLGFPVIKFYPPQCRAGEKSFTPGSPKLENGKKLPVPKAVAAVRSVVAERLTVNEDEVIILTALEKEWPDSCLGLAPAGFGCAQVVTPGYEVTVRVYDQQFVYRTNSDGSVVKAR